MGVNPIISTVHGFQERAHGRASDEIVNHNKARSKVEGTKEAFRATAQANKAELMDEYGSVGGLRQAVADDPALAEELISEHKQNLEEFATSVVKSVDVYG